MYTFATPLPMWGVEGSEMDLLPNMVTDFRDSNTCDILRDTD